MVWSLNDFNKRKLASPELEYYVTIGYDSSYAHNVVTGKGSVNINTLVANAARSALANLRKAIGVDNIHMVWVKGHNGCLMNEYADRQAELGRRRDTQESGEISPIMIQQFECELNVQQKAKLRFEVGQSLFVDLSVMLGNKSRYNFTRWAAHEQPLDACMAITVKEVGKRNVSFVLNGMCEHYIFRVPFKWTATKNAFSLKKHSLRRLITTEFLADDETRRNEATRPSALRQ